MARKKRPSTGQNLVLFWPQLWAQLMLHSPIQANTCGVRFATCSMLRAALTGGGALFGIPPLPLASARAKVNTPPYTSTLHPTPPHLHPTPAHLYPAPPHCTLHLQTCTLHLQTPPYTSTLVPCTSTLHPTPPHFHPTPPHLYPAPPHSTLHLNIFTLH